MKEKPKIAISPISNGYLTKGKEYSITTCYDSLFTIIDDEGDELYCLFEECSHLDGLDWILK